MKSSKSYSWRLLTSAFIIAFCGLRFSGTVSGQQTSPEKTSALVLLPREQEIALATSAAPEHLREGAAVYVFGKQGYEKVRAGANGFTCLVNRDGWQNGDQSLRPTCWDREGTATIVPVVLRVGQWLAQGKAATQIKRDIDAGFAAGRFRSPRKTGIAYMLSGDVQQYNSQTGQIEKRSFPPHYMIYAPNVTNADIGMTREAFQKNSTLPIVYSGYAGGTRTSYLIIVAGENKGHSH